MKALTLWQPWASMVALGEKRVETRCWSTKHRGELAIHAAAAIPPKWLGKSAQTAEFQLELADVMNCKFSMVGSRVNSLPLGAVLCIVKLHNVVPVEEVREILCQRELIFGNYDDGRYARQKRIKTLSKRI
jgi:hypothetical protein